MKVQEFIARLQRIMKAEPNAEVVIWDLKAEAFMRVTPISAIHAYKSAFNQFSYERDGPEKIIPLARESNFVP